MDVEDTQQATADGELAAGAPDRPLQRGTSVGRYLVIDQIGSGAIGVVYSAYDSVLNRTVAVKLLRPSGFREAVPMMQDRLMREAQAMAQLTHPNVGTVFDVGTYQGQVFVAMELIDGVTMTAWLQRKQRSWRQIVTAFLQGGRGLAAAHRAGLIHRDIKPDNMMIGRDGRVRVVDFGLVSASEVTHESPSAARQEPLSEPSSPPDTLTHTGATLGSPAYMSPEQHRGDAVTASSDQFSFCVALHEALYQERPFRGATREELAANVVGGRLAVPSKAASVPAWLRALVLRGLSAKPDERHPSMDAMLKALAADPARRRRRVALWAIVVVALIVGGGGLLVGMRGGDKEVACRNVDRHLSGIWDEPRKQAVQRVFGASKRPYHRHSFERVRALLDRYAETWVSMSRQSCRATKVHGDQSEAVFALRQQCLGRRLSELDALVGLLSKESSAKVLDRAVKAAYKLTPLKICADVQFLRTRSPLPDNPSKRKRVAALRARIDQAKALARVGSTKAALQIVKSLTPEVEALDYAPLRAEALLVLGDLQSKTNAVAAAEKTLVASGKAAARAMDDRLAARVLIKLIYLIGNLSDRRREALALVPAAEMAVARAGGGKILTARMLNAVGVVYDADGKYAKAAMMHRRALALYRQALGDRDPQVATSHNNLGVVLKEMGRYADAIRHYKMAQAIRRQVLDPRHPDMGNTLNNLGVVYDEMGDDDRAMKYLRKALAIWSHALGANNLRVAFVTHNIGTIHAEHGRYGKALEFYRRSLDIRTRLFGERHQYTLRVRQNMAVAMEGQGKKAHAYVEYVEILKINEAVLGPHHPGVASTLSRLGYGQYLRGDLGLAVTTLQRAVDIYTRAHGSSHLDLVEPLLHLVRVYARQGKLSKARAHAERARRIAIHTYGARHQSAAAVDILRAALTRREGKPKAALAIVKSALPILRNQLSKHAPLVVEARAELARINKVLGASR